MRILVTGSSGHLGEALMRTLPSLGHEVLGIDLLASPFTQAIGSIADRSFVQEHMHGIDAVLHTATLHKPHVKTHSRQDFVDTNITGTLNLLEESVAAGVNAFVFTSTTSTFGDALTPKPGDPAAWITEEVQPRPKNIYGVTKTAAEDLCALFSRNQGLPCIVLRTSRFFPEADDNKDSRQAYSDNNLKVNELLYRRADIADMVSAHIQALKKASTIGFGKYIVSATSPFTQHDLQELAVDAPAVLSRKSPQYRETYERLGWKMLPRLDRVYANEKARRELDWEPVFGFDHALASVREGRDWRSPLSLLVGSKGYHEESFTDGPFPV